jgi:FG-GAP-like repeat
MKLSFCKIKNTGMGLALLALFAGGSPVGAQTFFPSSPLTNEVPYCVAVADVNGDGLPDLITANILNNGTSTLTVLTNSGKGDFIYSADYPVGVQAVQPAAFLVAADVNGDGKPDLISANYLDNTLTVLTNNGNGTFTPSSTNTVGANPFTVAIVNVTSKTSVDLVCGNAGENTLTILTNSGNGIFTVSDTIAVSTDPNSTPLVTAADVNGDGWADLICANLGDNDIMVLTNNGHGQFIVSWTSSVGDSPYNVAVADINGDGKPDLISVNSGDNNVIVFTNNGAATFTSVSTNQVGQTPLWVAAADVNRDGKTDLITANNADYTLTVLTNDGSGNFAFCQTIPVDAEPTFVTAADLNLDGAMDLVSANLGNNTVGSLTVLLDLPVLTVQAASPASALVSWPALWPGYVLQSTTNLSASPWVNVNNPTGTNNVTISPATGSRVFRLRHP